MKTQLRHTYEELISLDNLLGAWMDFSKGKLSKMDVQEFSLHLMDNLISLHEDLSHHTYRHGPYQAFNICDPKPRNIHKAAVRDRLLHHAICRNLYPFFDKTFISDSFSCRLGKGTHRAIQRFRHFCNRSSNNDSKTCWVLKGDVKKFFPSIDHEILLNILKQYIPDQEIMALLQKVIGSFSALKPDVGLPLGNLTSQLLVNIYMNEFDRFVKHQLKAKHYARCADDFVVVSPDRLWLESLVMPMEDFLQNELKLILHPDKLFLKTWASGVDFLGWVHFPDHSVLRTTTKRRMLKRVNAQSTEGTINSYLGLLGHGNAQKLENLLTEQTIL